MLPEPIHFSRSRMLKCVSEVREKQLEELTKFTGIIDKEIEGFARAVNWTITEISKHHENILVCPYDSSHRITKESLNRHLTSCQWKAEGYTEFDTPLSEATLSPNASSCIKFDARLQNDVLRIAKSQNPDMEVGLGERFIPRTSDRLLTDFTRDERAALYDYAVSNTVKPDIGQNVADTRKTKSCGKEDKELSFLELLAQERNLKRRRAKHRGVHTNKKSHTEIIREVINQEMDIYVNYIKENNSTARIIESKKYNDDTQNLDARRKKPVRSLTESSSGQQNAVSENTSKYRPSVKSNKKYERSGGRQLIHDSDYERGDKYSPSIRDSTNKRERSEYKRRPHSRDRKSDKDDKYRRSKYINSSTRKKH